MTIEWQDVSSSCISKIGYDLETGNMSLIFVDGGEYEYENVGPAVVLSLLSASSVGKAFWTLIKDKYSYQRVA